MNLLTLVVRDVFGGQFIQRKCREGELGESKIFMSRIDSLRAENMMSVVGATGVANAHGSVGPPGGRLGGYLMGLPRLSYIVSILGVAQLVVRRVLLWPCSFGGPMGTVLA